MRKSQMKKKIYADDHTMTRNNHFLAVAVFQSG